MSAIDDGGPAFPNNDQHGCAFAGMTLRDWFAGHALAGWLASYNPNSAHPEANETTEDVARQAYAMADAMLAARKGGAND